VNLEELRKLVERGENEQVEFKKSTGQRTSAAKTVCAMLNGLGGFVIFGVTDTAQVDAEHKANRIRILEGVIGGMPGLTAQITAQVTAQVLHFCREPRRASEIMEILKLKHWKTFQINYLNPLLEAEFIERTIPDKPRSSKQRYRLTEKSKALLDSAKKESP